MYNLLEHEADVGVLGIGKTLEESFEEGAKAMFSVMVDFKGVREKEEVLVRCEALDEESLFVEWLNELLSLKDIENMFFVNFKVKIKKIGNVFKLDGVALGEEMNLKKQKVKVEVKAATYSGLKLEKKNNKYYIQCVVDV